ncbi:MAG: trypsin-like peptidase domain-containing protein [Saprospiraceae bacterium]|nr:trypsin-like peptidase domain-containing protein [Saprospiraceae bacterium]
MSIEEQLIQTTCLINSINTKDSTTSFGTGFFYQDSLLLPSKILLITNKHVVKNNDVGIILFNQIDKSGNIYGNKVDVMIKKFNEQWKMHPNPNIDLCFMDITPLLNYYKSKGCNLFTRTLSNTLIPSDSLWNRLTVLEEVIMIGYPNGLIDNKNNIPIIRTGVTATPPKLDYNGKKEFLVDIAAFPGSSGSPLIIKRTPFGTRSVKNGVSFGIFPEYYFSGILYAGPTYVAETKKLDFISIEELSEKTKLQTNIMLNLGNIIKSTEIAEMIKYYK